MRSYLVYSSSLSVHWKSFRVPHLARDACRRLSIPAIERRIIGRLCMNWRCTWMEVLGLRHATGNLFWKSDIQTFDFNIRHKHLAHKNLIFDPLIKGCELKMTPYCGPDTAYFSLCVCMWRFLHLKWLLAYDIESLF